MVAWDWQALIGSFAVVAFVLIAWSMIEESVGRWPAGGRAALFGAIMGTGSLLAMLVSIPLGPGVFLDLRVSFVALAGLFGGPLACLIAAAMAAAYRFAAGGAGIWAGLFGILAGALIGAIAHGMAEGRRLRYWHLAVFSLAVGTGSFVAIGAMPPDLMRRLLSSVALPATALVVAGTLAGGVVLLHDRRRAEAARTNAVYRAVMDTLPDSLNAKDLGGRFIVANPATARLMRAGSADDLIGRTDFDFYPPETAGAFAIDERRALEDGEPLQIEQRTRYEDGTTGWLSTLKAPLRDEAGRIQGLISHNRDITERKLLQDNVERIQRRLDEAMNHMADGLAMFDADGVLRLCNERYWEIFPKTADVRVVGTSIEAIVRAAIERGEQEPGTAGPDALVAETRRHLFTEGERTITLGDGRAVELRTRQLADGGALVAATDVTDRRRAEAAVAASEARYRLLAENVADLIVRIGPNGRCQFASPACRTLLGYQQEQMLGRHALGVVHIPDRPAAALAFETVMAGGKVDALEVRAVRADGEVIFVEINARPVEAEGGLVLSMRDITQRKIAEQELAAAMAQLEALASTDGLTGLATRRVFDAALEREFARSSRERTPLSLFLVDVDRFKAYNDSYGHPMGDDCLRFLAQTLIGMLRRPADIAARYGGEELAAILPNTDAAGARQLAETFRDQVRRLGLAHVGSEFGVVTVSVGVASTDGTAGLGEARELVRQADAALYRAKGGGRDRVAEAKAA